MSFNFPNLVIINKHIRTCLFTRRVTFAHSHQLHNLKEDTKEKRKLKKKRIWTWLTVTYTNTHTHSHNHTGTYTTSSKIAWIVFTKPESVSISADRHRWIHFSRNKHGQDLGRSIQSRISEVYNRSLSFIFADETSPGERLWEKVVVDITSVHRPEERGENVTSYIKELVVVLWALSD